MGNGPEFFPAPATWHWPGAEESVESPARDRGGRIATFVDLARKGCHEAYRELVERHRDRIYRFCLGWVGVEEDAEELCQDVFVRAFSALPRFRGEQHFSAWLYRIARNCCHDHRRSLNRRKRKREQALDVSGDEGWICPQRRPDERVVESEELERLRKIIADLPESLREVILLCCLEGMSQEECAAILRCSRRAVEGRLYRARLELARRWFT